MLFNLCRRSDYPTGITKNSNKLHENVNSLLFVKKDYIHRG